MSGIARYVKYFIVQKAKGKAISANEFSTSEISLDNNLEQKNNFLPQNQVEAIDKYLNSREELTAESIAGSFTDFPDNRRTSQWPNLKQALKICVELNCTLIIGELGTFSSNEAFTKLILDSNVSFYCCDQPFIDKNILEALHKHARIQREFHGKLIRDGLKRTSNKSGNPRAAEVISKVNEPKIHTAIVFADLIAPIIADYNRNGYSQRQMVKMLNDENFTAPEGGKWVLSQLQKVLDRVKLNEIAAEAGSIFKELKQQGLDNSKIAEEFNGKGIKPIRKTPWDENQVLRLEERLNQLDKIDLINDFASEIIDIIQESNSKGQKAWELMQTFEENQLTIKQENQKEASI